MKITGELVGLRGIKHTIKAVFIAKGSEIAAILKAGHGATAAGQSGAINIYWDDDNFVRCEAMVFQKIVEQKQYKAVSESVGWANKWIKKINK